MFLALDIGNTRTKAAVFEPNGELVIAQHWTDDAYEAITDLIAGHRVQHVITSQTGDVPWAHTNWNVKGKQIFLNSQTKLPVRIVYSTPETLGADRIAGVCGAHSLFPRETCIVFSAGTCLTMDVITASGVFLGGNIAPGLRMRLTSMHQQTSRLPLVEAEWPDTILGDSTIHALQNGAALGMIMEMNGFSGKIGDRFGAHQVILTGGDAAFLAKKAESRIFVLPELVVKGLFTILSFNVH